MTNLEKLLGYFTDNKESIIRNWNETQTRIELINPLFECLGWDVNNDQHLADSFKEVIHEDAIKIQGATKAPDYSFNYGRRLFFLEAKKPKVNIKEDISPAYQLRRYAWSAKLPISVLTDFEELAIYDCRVKPKPNDNAGVARIKYYNYSQYLDKWDDISGLLSKEAIKKGAIDKFNTSKRLQGTIEVDKDFLNELEKWRIKLASNIALRNITLFEKEINYSVQKIIDRLIFLRICEDRGIEIYGTLQNLLKNKNDLYKGLIDIFLLADDNYNSGLFAFNKKDKMSDCLTPTLNIDNHIIKDIITGLYYPICPYQFNQFSADLLGSVYERFIGKVITLSPSHRIKSEEKPEVRKAGGVFYTPKYIVNYIVKNTIGKMLKEKTLSTINDFSIIDISCGSGAFLIEAYQYLLDWYLNAYKENGIEKYTKGKTPKVFKTVNDVFLTIEERKRIVITHIYGVDIDYQAIEVTKLSLLLKVLEDETHEIKQLTMMKEHILPNLGNNIKCGNSLIDSGYYDNQDLSLFGNEQIEKINVFDWTKEFGNILSRGGFDVIIGNPPYVKEYTDNSAFTFKHGYLKKYYKGKMDLWYAFGCLSIDLLKTNGFHSFIATNNWSTSAGASILRNKILNETKILSYIDFSDYKVFQSASIQTMIYVLNKSTEIKNHNIDFTKVLNKTLISKEIDTLINNRNNENNPNVECFQTKLITNDFIDKTFTFVNPAYDKVLKKIQENASYLKSHEIAQGIVCPQDFVIDKHLEILKAENLKKGDGIFVISEKEKEILKLSEKEVNIIHPLYTTNELFRYYGENKNKFYVIYTNKENKENINRFPKIKAHLDKYKKIITSDSKPYGLHRARNQDFFEGNKIISLRKTKQPKFTYTDFSCYVSQTYFVINPLDMDLKYLTGLLNSKLVYFWLFHRGKKQGDQLQIDKAPLLEIPLTQTTDKSLHDELVSLVNQMLTAQKKHNEARTEQDRAAFSKLVEVIDKKIDSAVYAIYGLSESDIKTIENNLTL